MNEEKMICSVCKKQIIKGAYYVKDLFHNKIICCNCDQGLLIKADNFLALDEYPNEGRVIEESICRVILRHKWVNWLVRNRHYINGIMIFFIGVSLTWLFLPQNLINDFIFLIAVILLFTSYNLWVESLPQHEEKIINKYLLRKSDG